MSKWPPSKGSSVCDFFSASGSVYAAPPPLLGPVASRTLPRPLGPLGEQNSLDATESCSEGLALHGPSPAPSLLRLAAQCPPCA